MKIIDLLLKISKGEEVPKKIKYEDEIFIFNGSYYIDENNYDIGGVDDSLGAFFILDVSLNDEVEILEDTPKQIEKFTFENTGLAVTSYNQKKLDLLNIIYNSNFDLEEVVNNLDK